MTDHKHATDMKIVSIANL